MKRYTSFLNFVLLTCGFCYGAETPKIFTLSNGLRVYLLRDNSLPYIQYNLLTNVGSSQDPAGKQGLASFTAQMLERGTLKHTPMEILKKLDTLGTSLGIYTNQDFTILSVDTLSWHNEKLLEIFSEIVSQPSFSEKEISWQKNQFLSTLQKLPESASQFTNKVVRHLLFQGKPISHSPLGFKHSVEKFTASEVKQFYETHFVPQNSILGVTGTFSEDIKKQLEERFSKWKKTESLKTLRKIRKQRWKRENRFLFFKKNSPIVIPSFNFSNLKITFIDKKGQSQSEIRVAKPFIPRTSPDYILIQMANIILGSSGLDSRLFNKIRKQHGLTYSIYSQMLPSKDHGLLNIMTSTRLEVTRETVNRIIDVIEDFYKNGVTEDELQKAKNTYKVQILKSTETPTSRLLRRITLNSYGLPMDLNSIHQELHRIQLEDVNRAIRKYFFFDQMQIIIFSDFNKIEDQFQDFGNKQTHPFHHFM